MLTLWEPYNKVEVDRREIVQRRDAGFVTNRHENTSNFIAIASSSQIPYEWKRILSLSSLTRKVNERRGVHVPCVPWLPQGWIKSVLFSNNYIFICYFTYYDDKSIIYDCPTPSMAILTIRQDLKWKSKLNNTARKPIHILDFSVEILNISSTSVDFKAMYAVIFSANSRMVERRPTGISLI
jgi:hypothetical protein